MSGVERTSAEAKVLWTGGWNSTFRVLQVLLVRRHPVQPFYVLDSRRRSALLEVEAMQQIRERIADRDPDAAADLRPLSIVLRDNLAEDGLTARRLTALRQRGHLGHQYEFLTRFAAQSGLADLELTGEADTGVTSSGPLFFLRERLVRLEDGNGPYWCLDRKAIATDEDLALFAPFRFPLLNMTKLQMREEASAMGVLDILNATWFCHTPTADDQACGRCPPCIRVVQEGVRDGLSRRALVRYYARPLEPLARLIKRTARVLAHPR